MGIPNSSDFQALCACISQLQLTKLSNLRLRKSIYGLFMNSKNNEIKYKKLQRAVSLHDLAHILGFSPSGLSYILYAMGKKDNKIKYTTFQIKKKKDGDYRNIKAPCPQLKELQKRLSDLLYACLKEINQQNSINQSFSFAYQPDKTHFHNAKIHKRKRYVFNIDLRNFFDSINFGRVRGYFILNEYFELNPKVATIIAQIACDENVLPQGSPCSPIISHFIANILDYRLSQLATKAKCHYSRYCDDITFSTNQKEFPKLIAELKDDSWHVSDVLQKTIERTGFQINDKKVRMSYQPNQQSVTGLVVNKRVNTYRKYRDTTRALVHSLTTTGDFVFTKDFEKEKRTDNNKLDCLQGMLCYIRHIDKESMNYQNNTKNQDRNTQSKHKKYTKLKNFRVTFKNFVLYRYFFAHEKVVIFGEGKTDTTHLKQYLKNRGKKTYSNHSETPSLLEEWRKIQLLKFENKIFDCISKDGGTGDIKNLISSYAEYCKKFYIPKKQNPVIILVDNDQGSQGIFGLIENKTKSKQDIDRSQDFYHIAYNLYVVFLPKLDNKNTAIEDYYNEEIRDILYKNKKLSLSNKYDTSSTYGKNTFATKIIPNNTEQVDWSRFDPIFNRIQAVINDFNNKRQQNQL